MMITALKSIDWPALVDWVQSQALTLPGRVTISELENPETWTPTLSQARLKQLETQEIASLLDRDGIWSCLNGLEDCSDALTGLTKSVTLGLADLVIIRSWLNAVDTWNSIPRDELKADLFKKSLSILPDLSLPLRRIDSVLTAAGEISERASPKLAALTVEMRNLKRDIEATLSRLVNQYTSLGYTQDAISDQRDGRYVIAVKANHQGEVDGFILDSSASGQTVFLEPKEVTVLNHKLRQKENEYKQEVFRVLSALSKDLAPFSAEIRIAFHEMVRWDVVQAKARVGRVYSGKMIAVSDQRNLELKGTAHPILWKALPSHQIIRNSIELDDTKSVLLISGPNTGGKTVFLKTIGIAAACARTGLQIPAFENPTVPFYHSIFSDLGDSQSIESNISSFSGHLMTFKSILESLTNSSENSRHSTEAPSSAQKRQSLVLLDELNTATDPEEGAALGRALIEALIDLDAAIITTTHDPILKSLAISDTRIVNASMAFDEKTRLPTYRLILGVPGRSRALETAERLGLPTRLIERAKSLLSAQHIAFEQTIATLEAKLAEAVIVEKKAIELKEEAEKIKNDWLEKTQTSIQSQVEKIQSRLKQTLELAQDEVRATLRRLDQVKGNKAIQDTRIQLDEIISTTERRLSQAPKDEAPDLMELLAEKKTKTPANETAQSTPQAVTAPNIKLGDFVRIPKWKNTGEVLEVKPNSVKVALGKMQVTLSMSEIELVSQKEGSLLSQQKNREELLKTQKKQAVQFDLSANTSPKLDLRGKRFDEAMTELETYLDHSFRSGIHKTVTIVHGLGSGALREGCKKLLRKLPYVKETRDGGAGEGGTGATLVEFDMD